MDSQNSQSNGKPYKAVLAGCSAMAGLWLREAKKIENLSVVGIVDIDLEAEWRIIGENGTVTWDGAEGFRGQIVEECGGFHSRFSEPVIPELDASARVGGPSGVLRKSVYCVDSGTIPETICTDNIKSLAMVFAAIRSAETSKILTL